MSIFYLISILSFQFFNLAHEESVLLWEHSNRESKRIFFAVEDPSLSKIKVNEFSDFRFVSWIKSEEIVFPEVLRIGE